MKLIKSLLLFVLAITLVGAGGIYLIQRSPEGKLPIAIPQLNTPTAQKLMPIAQQLFASAQDIPLPAVQQQLGKVLGETHAAAIEKAPTNQPQFAFETARYTYCKQVIEDYDARYSSTSASQNAEETE